MEITPRIIPALYVFPAKAGTSTAKQTLPMSLRAITPQAVCAAISHSLLVCAPFVIPTLFVIPAQAGTSSAKQSHPTVIASLAPQAEGVAISVTSTCHMKEMLQQI